MNWSLSGTGWKQAIVVGACCIAGAVQAQDLGSLLKNVFNNRPADMMNLIIQSVSDVSSGNISAGTPVPADSEGKVVLYSTSWCGYCKRSASYMRQKNIPFIERDIESNAAYKAEYKRAGGKGPVPFLVFGTQTMQGFSEVSIDRHYADFQRTMASRPVNMDAPAALMQPTPQLDSSGTLLQSGDMVVGKIAGVKVYAQPSRTAPKLLALGKTEEAIYMGEERDGLYRVTTAIGEGWVDKLLVRRR